MLVRVDDDRFTLLLRNRDRHDLVLEHTASPGRRPSAPGERSRESILILARNVEFRGDIVGRLRHRVDAILLLHRRIDEAPSDCGVINCVGTRPGAVGLRHHEGRARHALDAAGDHEIAVSGLDRPGGHADRIHARTA